MSRVLGKKLTKVLEIRTDTPSMLESLEAISEFYVKGNTIDARKSLRQDLDKQNYNLSLKFLESFEKLKKKIEAVEQNVNDLETSCGAISSRLSAADDHMHLFMKEAKALENKRTQLSQRVVQVTDFLTHFQLGEAQCTALNSIADGKPPGPEFFSALKQLATIRHEAASLMASRHQSAGFELVENLARQQETAYEQLYRWVQEQCSVLQDENSEADASLQVAMKALRERPVYFQHCQESIGALRRKLLSQRFQAALTGHGGGVQRPIDFQAHDPLRYVGDILAWVHQAGALEKELIGALFAPSTSSSESSELHTNKLNDNKDEHPESQPDVELSAEKVLDFVMSGIEQPLKARLAQVVQSQTDFVECYRLLSLLHFYMDTMARVLTPDSSLGKALAGILQQNEMSFFDLLKQMGDRLVSAPPSYPTDLSPLRQTVDTTKRLVELMQIHMSSMVDPSDTVESSKGIEEMLSAVIEPLLHMCRLSAEGLAPSDTATFMLNNASAMQTALNKFKTSSSWNAKLATEIETWLDSLVQHEHLKMLESCGLKQILSSMELFRSKGPASEQPGLDEMTLSAAMSKFYASLFTLVMPEFEKVQDPSIKVQARQRTAIAIANAHSSVYTMVSDDQNKYQSKTFLQHTPQQVKVLLDCD